jgi:hypothetical protein
MKSIKFLAAICLITFSSAIISAQGEKKVKHKEKAGISEIKEDLNLSEEQTLKVMESRTAAQAKIKVLKADEKMTREEKKAAFREIREDQKKDMDAILTKEQKEKRKEIGKSKRADMKKKREESKEKRKEMMEYRAEFDSKISEEDKQELARLRTVLEADRPTRGKGMRGEKGKGGMKGKVKGEGREMKEKGSEKRSEFREAHKEEFESLQRLSEKYEKEVEEFLGSKKTLQKEKAVKEEKRKKKMAARFLLMEKKEK